MTDDRQIPHDDLVDVIEMMNVMEAVFSEIVEENDKNLAMSALMSASINCMFSQCKTLEEILFHRNLFMQMIDSSVRAIKIQGPESL